MPRGDAHRAGRVSSGERDAIGGKLVREGRLDDRMGETAQAVTAPLVGKDEKKLGLSAVVWADLL